MSNNENNVPARYRSVGEVRQHRRTGSLYIREFVPGTDRVAWLRYDTFVLGVWRMFGSRVAREADLRPINRVKLGLRGRQPTFSQLQFT